VALLFYTNMVERSNNSMLMKKIFFFIALTSLSFSYAQPKLVVGIVVDQMRYDYIQKYWAKFDTKGFKRLMKEGLACNNTNYNYVPTFTAPGHASIFTGVTPSVHGIVSNQWYDTKSRKKIYCVGDKSARAVGGDSASGAMSPRNLITSTVGEELRKKNSDLSKVIGIALKDRGAILPAGHHANAAYWYDGSTGNWITSTYYMTALPKWVSDFNKLGLSKKYLSQSWTTLLPIEKYIESAADNNEYESLFEGKITPTFPYDLPSLMKDNDGLGLIRSTPFGNSLTKDFALETIQKENMGKGDATDFLTISFSSPDYIGHQFGPQSVEVEDCYLRLDKDIEDLLKFLDKWIGKENVLVFLTSDHGASDAAPYLLHKKLPGGVMDAKIISDSLTNFFVQQYGDSLLMRVSDFDAYFDRKKIELKKLPLAEIQKKAATHLLKINGIQDAISSTEIEQTNFQDSIRSKVKAGFNSDRCGDLIFVLKPGWLIGFRKGTTHGTPYSYDTHVPLIGWGYSVTHGISNEELSITQIAPTLSAILKTPLPNGCNSKPISSLIK
jgi:predicted AlkP superfamily pyrophosphatase or phosphodiesterase